MNSLFLPDEGPNEKDVAKYFRHQDALHAMAKIVIGATDAEIDAPTPSLQSNAFGVIRSTAPVAQGNVFDFDADLVRDKHKANSEPSSRDLSA